MSSQTPEVVASIDGQKQSHRIDKWIHDMKDIHKARPSTQASYRHNMPDPMALMQVWPVQVEEFLSSHPLPPAELDVSLEEYLRIVCSVLDIPTHDELSDSLSVLLQLYIELQQSQHAALTGLSHSAYMPPQ